MSVLALLLLFVGQHVDSARFTHWITIKTHFLRITEPFYWAGAAPGRWFAYANDNLINRQTLVDNHAKLNEEVLLLKARLQTLAALEAENGRLRALLNAAARVNDKVLAAQLLTVSPDPTRHDIVINKGMVDDVYLGQPVIDESGLVGQVVSVGPHTSRVLLISDTSHAVPVQINRNGVRSVVEGKGLHHQLDVRHMAATADIQVGDLLVTSGLGQRFPAGYPVATVTSVTIDPGQSFAVVTAEPSAQLMQGRHVLLVFRSGF